MSANHHTAIAANASAVNTTFNTPLGALDAKLTHAVVEYAAAGPTATTVTSSGTYYPVTSHQVSFTPAYTGQVFMISLVVGYMYADTAGVTTLDCRIVDGANASVVDSFIMGRNNGATTSAAGIGTSGVRAWTAAAGDVGNTRKARVYVTHSVNGTAVSLVQVCLQAITH